MFLLEKYKPHNIRDFVFNKDVMEQLVNIATSDNIPHIIISGPEGAGKKTLLKYFLRTLYDKNVERLSKVKCSVSGSSTKKDIEIMQSNYHIEIEPTNTNHDKHILQEIIKQYAKNRSFSFETNRKFKTIVIYNIENLATNSQAALRRTMESYAKTCRFVMLCNNLSKIIDPLESRCRIFCVSLPTDEDISKIIARICFMEGIDLSSEEHDKIITDSKRNLKEAIWMLESKRLNINNTISLMEIVDDVVDLILSCTKSKNIVKVFDESIRYNAYNILITTIKGSDVIKILMERLIDKIDDDYINAKIIHHASVAEYNMVHGRRDITHIDYFVSGAMRELILKSEETKEIKKNNDIKKTKNKDKVIEA